MRKGIVNLRHTHIVSAETKPSGEQKTNESRSLLETT